MSGVGWGNLSKNLLSLSQSIKLPTKLTIVRYSINHSLINKNEKEMKRKEMKENEREERERRDNNLWDCFVMGIQWAQSYEAFRFSVNQLIIIKCNNNKKKGIPLKKWLFYSSYSWFCGLHHKQQYLDSATSLVTFANIVLTIKEWEKKQTEREWDSKEKNDTFSA